MHTTSGGSPSIRATLVKQEKKEPISVAISIYHGDASHLMDVCFDCILKIIRQVDNTNYNVIDW